MQAAHVAEAQRQVAVRAQRVAIDQRGLRAVHRLETEGLLFGLDQEHVLPEVFPVPRLLPQLLVDQDRRGDFLVAVGVEHLPHELLQLAHDRPAAGQPERCPGRDVVEDEQVELAPELAMIALLRFLQAPEILVELLLAQPGGAIDALEHRVLLVAAPVGARRRQQLEEAHLSRPADVRPPAQVDEVALPVERHAVGGDALEDLDLEALPTPPEEGDRLRARHLLPLERDVGLADHAHLVLDAREVLRGERLALGEVVVEAILDGGADGHLHVGEQPLHRLRHHVRGGVAQRGQRRRIAVEVAGQLEVSLFFRLGHTFPACGGMVGSGGFEPPTSSASERRSPTELRAYPRVPPMLPTVSRCVKTTCWTCRRFDLLTGCW